MNIIFGKQEADQLNDKYIILELDTISIRDSAPITAYCIVENIPLEKLSQAEPYKKLHASLMENYRSRNWKVCLDSTEQLMGFWGDDMDTFYDVLNTRLTEYQTTEPDDTWTPVIKKT